MRPLDLGIDLEHVAVRVPEEQGSMAKGMVGGARHDVRTAFLKDFRAACDFAWRYPEGKLHGESADWKLWVVEPSTVFGQGQQVGAHTILDPSRAELSVKGESESGAVERSHGGHLARKDDGVVDGADREFRIHGSR